MVQPNID